jgi:hypothetical protein
MKIFLVISIIAFWWVPTNSPGNIGISSFLQEEPRPFQSKIYDNASLNIIKASITKRKMDHFGFQSRKKLLKNYSKRDGGKLSKPIRRYARKLDLYKRDQSNYSRKH